MVFEGNPELSNFLGWISIACWIVVYSPQIIENYQLQSGEGLSVGFVVTWLIGDLCNTSGAILAGLQPTIIILGVYYSVCDATLLAQIYYYRWKRTRRNAPLLITEDSRQSALYDESSPLLPGDGRSEEPSPVRPVWQDGLRYIAAMVFVFGVGVGAWAVDKYIRYSTPPLDPQEEVVEWRSQVLGWISAALFLGARVPQIVKNLSTRCEGLSPFLFVYSISGNTTYVLSILAASLSMKHLVVNGPWIAGSALTVFLDVFVLYQFFEYRQEDKRRASG
ncbi:PQ-loop-domain-containing protein [Dichomitus squalens]|uniref:PQ-loop-domain-containing protein n=2 Tax=Dichomitus squalens TaxID=114155 RepID=A0A4Q9MJY0_9APHY|nr:PQ-loop-domain-containing protein [Dichomitus squalens LYAD-421 SS1]EJF61077.1 PQ-loop-domain-containing protein [Dichomitus squalens LYAD-421 SS1]TBU27038.1 PQ-loop-domain-containing protein [Dichomitus squalens]TBU45811.1 PQ-loop-domain-containing protein [Dichomitus squalens]TBU56562.1 PQ-loop-domain-containing protein [Dichomitus squalens]